MSAVVDLFCGVGWGDACASLGIDERGIDLSEPVAEVRRALGWSTTLADIAALNPDDWNGAEGLIASPPCQSWSTAGNRKGLDDPRGELVWQPLVWARAIRPRWVVCEQVPEAAEVFRVIAGELRLMGYRATVGTLSAEQFGVAQTRKRMFLVAHRDHPVSLPPPTHERYSHQTERGASAWSMFPLEPWVPMADVLDDVGPRHALKGGRANGTERSGCQPGPTITTRLYDDGGRWELRYRRGAGMVDRHGARPDQTLDEPSFTITRGAATGGAKHQWWPAERPATTIQCDPRVSSPGHHAGSQNAGAVPADDAGEGMPVALTAEQGCRLMGFSDRLSTAILALPTKRALWGVIGNAVCPPVGAAILRAVKA